MQSVHWEGFVTHILRNPFTRKDDRYSEKKSINLCILLALNEIRGRINIPSSRKRSRGSEKHGFDQPFFFFLSLKL